MGETTHGEHHRGEMDISDQKATFSGFMAVTAWGSALTVMLVALLVTAFALGGGWFGGVAVWAALGLAAGLALNLGLYWWAMLIGSTALMAIGGGIAALIAPLIA